MYHPIFAEHGVEWHIEKADRLASIREQLVADDLWDQMTPVDAPMADEDTIAMVHTRDYIDQIRRLSEAGGGQLDHDTIATEETWEAACRAVGGCVDAVDAILDGQIDTAACLVRPPGHHALPNRGMGFCFFNNAAIAAEHAIRHRRVSPVAIVDFDVHHGNGTQDFFYNRGDVLYASTHQDPFFPGTGLAEEMGVDEGLRRTVNFPLPRGCTDKHILRCYDAIILPLLRKFDPELIIVSAGYDGYHGDPLAGHRLSTDCFHALSSRVQDVAEDTCDGRVCMTLEGGYNLDVLGLCVENSILAMMGRSTLHPDPKPEEDTLARPGLAEHVRELIEFHRQWHGVGG